MRTPRNFLLLLMMVLPVAALAAQARVDWRADDPARRAWLDTNGRTIERTHVRLTAPRDSMTAAHQQALADSLERGVLALHDLVGTPLEWQRHDMAPVHILLAPGRFVSHANGDGTVFIPISLARQGQAPYLHESAHVLLTGMHPYYAWEQSSLATRRDVAEHSAQWLVEGLPNLLAQRAATTTGIREANVFATDSLGSAHATCSARVLHAARVSYGDDGAVHTTGQTILDAIGARGLFAPLSSPERNLVAPTYYTCAESFVTYLVDALGLEAVVALTPAIPSGRWAVELERLAAMPLDLLRLQWQKQLGVTPRSDKTRIMP